MATPWNTIICEGRLFKLLKKNCTLASEWRSILTMIMKFWFISKSFQLEVLYKSVVYIKKRVYISKPPCTNWLIRICNFSAKVPLPLWKNICKTLCGFTTINGSRLNMFAKMLRNVLFYTELGKFNSTRSTFWARYFICARKKRARKNKVQCGRLIEKQLETIIFVLCDLNKACSFHFCCNSIKIFCNGGFAVLFV